MGGGPRLITWHGRAQPPTCGTTSRCGEAQPPTRELVPACWRGHLPAREFMPGAHPRMDVGAGQDIMRAAGRGGGPAPRPALCTPRLQPPGRAPGPALPGARAAKCAGYRQAIVWASLRSTHLCVYVCYRFLLRLYSVVMILIVGNCAKWE